MFVKGGRVRAVTRAEVLRGQEDKERQGGQWGCVSQGAGFPCACDSGRTREGGLSEASGDANGGGHGPQLLWKTESQQNIEETQAQTFTACGRFPGRSPWCALRRELRLLDAAKPGEGAAVLLQGGEAPSEPPRPTGGLGLPHPVIRLPPCPGACPQGPRSASALATASVFLADVTHFRKLYRVSQKIPGSPGP